MYVVKIFSTKEVPLRLHHFNVSFRDNNGKLLACFCQQFHLWKPLPLDFCWLT